MIARHQLLSSVALALMSFAVAFTPSGPAFVASKVQQAQVVFLRPTTTCLRAEGSSSSSEEQDFPQPKDNGGPTDILSSPAFLKRKIDVLNSDIEEAENQIAQLKASVDEGKAEWESQLDKLRTEVSFCD
jgi:uncharacterized protein YlxW (UPF0749 family)